MPTTVLLAVLIGLAVIGYWMGRQRSAAVAGGRPQALHSRPGYYGFYVALWCAVPSILFAVLLILFSGVVIDWLVVGDLPDLVR